MDIQLVSKSAATWLTFAIAVSTTGCGDKRPDIPDWRTKGRYPVLRTAFKAGLRGFPADPTSVPRCTAQRKGLLIVGHNLAASLYAPETPAAPDFGNGGLSLRSMFLRDIEHAAWKSVGAEDAKQWKDPPVDWVTAIGIFKATSYTAPTMGRCDGGQYSQRCALTPGVMVGDLVVFEDRGTAICANRIKLQGPSAVELRGVQGLESVMEASMLNLLLGMTYSATETPPANASWPFLARAQNDDLSRFDVTIDGVVVQAAKR
jgi:hypothetical protein